MVLQSFKKVESEDVKDTDDNSSLRSKMSGVTGKKANMAENTSNKMESEDKTDTESTISLRSMLGTSEKTTNKIESKPKETEVEYEEFDDNGFTMRSRV